MGMRHIAFGKAKALEMDIESGAFSPIWDDFNCSY